MIVIGVQSSNLKSAFDNPANNIPSLVIIPVVIILMAVIGYQVRQEVRAAEAEAEAEGDVEMAQVVGLPPSPQHSMQSSDESRDRRDPGILSRESESPLSGVAPQDISETE